MNITEFEKVLDEVGGVVEEAETCPSPFMLLGAFTRLYEAAVALVTAEAFSTYDEQFDRLYRKSLEALEGK